MDCPSACTERTPEQAPAERQPALPLHITVYGPDAAQSGFDALAGEWNALLRGARSNVIFLTHEWQTTWWNHLGTGELWIVAFRDPETGRLLGIAPLYRYTGDDAETVRLTLVGCLEVCDYLDLIMARGREADVIESFWGWLNSADAPEWDVLDLCNLPESSVLYTAFADRARSAGAQVEVFQEDVAPQIPLPRHYAAYLQDQVDKKQRHEIRRKQRRAEREADIRFYLVDDRHYLEAEVDDFIALQRASRDDKADFMTPEMHRFFTAIAQVLHDLGYLRLFFLTIEGEKAATLFAFEYNRQMLLYNSGYDPDAHAHLSPGWVLLAYSIQYSIASGCTLFDFLQGDEEYKYRFGSEDYRVMRTIVQQKR